MEMHIYEFPGTKEESQFEMIERVYNLFQSHGVVCAYGAYEPKGNRRVKSVLVRTEEPIPECQHLSSNLSRLQEMATTFGAIKFIPESELRTHWKELIKEIEEE